MAVEQEDALWRAARRAKWQDDARAIYAARARLIELEALLRDITNSQHDAYERAAALLLVGKIEAS